MGIPQDTLHSILAVAGPIYYICALPLPGTRSQDGNLATYACLVTALLLVWLAELAVDIWRARGVLSTSDTIVPFAHVFALLFQSERLWSCSLYKEENGSPNWRACMGSWILMAASCLSSIASALSEPRSGEASVPRLPASGFRFVLVFSLLALAALPDRRGYIRLGDDNDLESTRFDPMSHNSLEDPLRPGVMISIRSAGGLRPWAKSFHLFLAWFWSADYLLQIVVAAVIKTLGFALSMAIPRLYGWFLASVGQLEPEPGMWAALLWLTAARFLGSRVLSLIQELTWARFEIAQQAGFALRIYTYVMRHEARFHEHIQFEYKMTAVHWASEALDMLNDVVLEGPFSLLTVIATASSLLKSYGLLVFLIEILSLAVKRIISSFGEQQSRRLRDEKDGAFQESSGHLINGLDQWRTVFLSGRVDENIKTYGEKHARLAQSEWAMQKQNLTFQVLQALVGTISYCVLLVVVIWNTSDTGKTTQSIVAFEGYLSLLDSSFHMLLDLPYKVIDKLFNLDRLRRLLQYPKQMTYGTDKLQITHGRIELKNINVKYGDKCVFEDFNLVCEPGQKTAIVGASGSGKSTIINLIRRYRDPGHGQVLIDGQDVRSLAEDELAQHIAYMPQDPQIISGSFMENIKYACPDATDSSAHEVAKRVGIHDHIMGQPKGYETTIQQHSPNMSGGQKQRLIIARMMLSRCQVLLADEMTSALDARSEEGVKRALKDHFPQATVVAIAHKLQTVKDAHKIIVLGQGASSTEIVQSGTHDELIEQGGEYKQLWDLSR